MSAYEQILTDPVKAAIALVIMLITCAGVIMQKFPRIAGVAFMVALFFAALAAFTYLTS